MQWEEQKHEESMPTPESVVDLVFAIVCRTLPVDHAWALYTAIAQKLTWLEDDPIAGIHPVHVAESAHGWMRPDAPDALLHLSRRTRLIMRLPKKRVVAARQLSGETLQIAGNEMVVGEARDVPLSRSTSLFARRVVIEENEEEERFIERQIDTMHEMDVYPKKILPGLAHPINTPEGQICTRLLSVEGLQLEESFKLQMQGLGVHKHLGCGIFIPHKPLAKVRV